MKNHLPSISMTPMTQPAGGTPASAVQPGCRSVAWTNIVCVSRASWNPSGKKNPRHRWQLHGKAADSRVFSTSTFTPSNFRIPAWSIGFLCFSSPPAGLLLFTYEWLRAFVFFNRWRFCLILKFQKFHLVWLAVNRTHLLSGGKKLWRKRRA